MARPWASLLKQNATSTLNSMDLGCRNLMRDGLFSPPTSGKSFPASACFIPGFIGAKSQRRSVKTPP